MLAWHELSVLLAEAETVLITSHVRPDGDSLGSALAMADLLIQKGKEVEIFNPSPTPARYEFLDPEFARVRFLLNGDERPKLDPDLILILDTGTWSQLAGFADYIRASKAKKVVIDHHVSQDDLNALRIVDVGAAATGVLIAKAFRELGGVITASTATALFAAIAMDTGWMHHANSSVEVFELMAMLTAKGARPHEIYQLLFERNRIERMRLLGLMLERLSTDVDGRLAYSYISWDDIMAMQAHPMETEDFINYPMGLRGVEVGLLFIGQRDGGTKVSFRSRGKVDVSAVAGQFGGGGHRPAAGASLTMPLEEAREQVLAATIHAMGRSG